MINGTQRMEWMKTLYAGEEKMKVECEKELAEFMEDVNRIVQCTASVRVQNKNLESVSDGVELSIQGLCCFSVVYRGNSRGSEGGLCGEEFVSEFEYRGKFPVKADFDPDLLWDLTEIGAEGAVCRPLGPRKLQLRCEIVLGCCIKANVLADSADHFSADSLETKPLQWNTSVITAKASKELSLSHLFVLPSEYPEMGRLLDWDARLFCENPRVNEQGIAFRASAMISFCYQSAEGNSQPVSFVLPLEADQFLECAALGGREAFIEGYPVDLRLQIGEDEAGEKRNLDISFSFLVDGLVYENRTLHCIADCYSTSEELEIVGEEFLAEEVKYWGHCMAPLELDLPLKDPEVTRMEMIRSSISVSHCVAQDQGIALQGKLKLSMIGTKEDGAGVSIREEQEVEIVFRPDAATELSKNDPGLHIELSAQVKEVECEVQGDQLRVRALVGANILLVEQRKEKRVVSVVSNGPSEQREGRVIFYYPEKNEEPWEIGKRFRVGMDGVHREMEKEGGKMPYVMMLIS